MRCSLLSQVPHTFHVNAPLASDRMPEPDWTPRTLEDRLLERYLAENPGELFLEVNVGGRDEIRGPRRLDGILIPGGTSIVHPRNSYRKELAEERIRGATVHLLEAKRVLNRNVIGQVEVGARLLDRDYAPGEIVNVAVCGHGNADLQWYCEEVGIRTALYPEVVRRPRAPLSPTATVWTSGSRPTRPGDEPS